MASSNFLDPALYAEGYVYGRLILTGEHFVKSGNRWAEARCECGTEARFYRLSEVRRGHTTSCGCYKHEREGSGARKHGGKGTRLYRAWCAMKGRCHRLTDRQYPDYGGRGIMVCEEWRQSFESFQTWALANGYSDVLTIDRIDNNAGYFPENCRWATYKEQARNTRANRLLTAFGETKSLAAWEEDERCAVSQFTLKDRLDAGTLTPEQSLTLASRRPRRV